MVAGEAAAVSAFLVAAVTGPDGFVYALGGWVGGGGGSNQVLAVVEAYDPATNAWAPKAPMPTPRAGLAAVTAGGLIYALGGGDGVGSPLATVETYDPKTDKWTSGSPLPAARTGLAAAVGPNGQIYAIGGNAADGTSTASVYSYDPATPAAGWAQQDPLSTERALLAAATGPGLVYAIGGYTSAANSDLDTVEAYMPYGFEQQVLNDLKKMGIVGTLLGGVARGSAGASSSASTSSDPATLPGHGIHPGRGRTLPGRRHREPPVGPAHPAAAARPGQHGYRRALTRVLPGSPRNRKTRTGSHGPSANRPQGVLANSWNGM